ncbi:hypothetical protein V9L05_22730 (plasmid) [Bernardetia sp. Wsw4-3y2]|uniref:hypothetical protein n=1 Tax=Bernardetia sp. Wsw4-3y2 TaxID=3127471 RepID=UPI0030D1590D
MIHIHKLSTQNYFDFLNQERKDPITGDLIKENDEVVICSSCKSAFLKESWEYLGNRHCEQNQTLEIIPKQSNLELKIGLLTFLALVPKEDIFTKFLGVLILEIVAFSFVSISSDDSLALLVIGLIAFLIPVTIGILVMPTTKINLYSSYLSIKKIIGEIKIEYREIKYITINCNHSKSTSSYIYIKQTNGTSTKIPLEKKYLEFHKNEELLDFVNYLSRYTQVVLKIDSRYKNAIKGKDIPVKIEWL